MTTTQNPAGSNVDQLADSGLARLAGWCYDHRCLVLPGSAAAAE